MDKFYLRVLVAVLLVAAAFVLPDSRSFASDVFSVSGVSGTAGAAGTSGAADVFTVSGASPALKSKESGPAILSLVEGVRFHDPVFFCGSRVPLEKQDVRERLEKEFLLAMGDPAQVILWLKRSARYFPYIESVLKREGLPDDLKYLAVIESGLRAHAGSSKQAIGFWQFMGGTGKDYGLRVDEELDERRNFFKSTTAACLYLKNLKEKFGSWPLAAAAYNMGENGLASERRIQGELDYYSLYLSLETQHYVFKIIAAKIIMENKEKYGFPLTREDLYPQIGFDRVDIESPYQVSLMVIANSARTTFKEIKDLNPEIRGYFLPRGSHSIMIPKGASNGFKARFIQFLGQEKQAISQRVHVVKPGDSVLGIAKRYQIPLPSLLRWNGLTPKSNIHPGDRLVVTSK